MRVIIRGHAMLQLSNEKYEYGTEQIHSCSAMSDQPTKLWLVKIPSNTLSFGLVRRLNNMCLSAVLTLLPHSVTPNKEHALNNHAIGIIRATSHTRLRARDHYTSSTLIGGKDGVGPSSLHTKFEGPTEYVLAQWM